MRKLRSKPRRGDMFVAPAGPKPRHKPHRGDMFVAPAGPKPRHKPHRGGMFVAPAVATNMPPLQGFTGLP